MLKQRIMTAIVAVVLLLAVLFVAPIGLARAVIAMVFLAAAWEWSGFLGVSGSALRATYVALFAALLLTLYFILPDAAVYGAVAWTTVAWWSAALVWIFFYPTPIPAVVRWLCGLLVLLPAYTAIDWLYQQSSALLLGLLIIVWLADIGAYFAGRAFGRVKLAPSISPGKTWEGVLGGLIAVVVAAGLTALLQRYALSVLVPFALAIALISIVGDLTVSMFKRSADVKDSGSLFPGHGGVLDRIDSVCAAAPLFAVGMAAMGPI